MMLINIKVAFRFDLQIIRGLTGKSVQHVIKESDAGIILIVTFSVQVKADTDLCLFGGTVNCRFSHADPP